MASQTTQPSSHNGDLTHRTQLDVTDEEFFEVSIARAIAAAENKHVTESTVQLYDHIDPDAIERLFVHANTKDEATWTIEFTVDELDVIVGSDGGLVIY